MDTVIFDLDGTLLNTLEDLYICFNYAIGEFGYPARTEEEIKGSPFDIRSEPFFID